MKIIVVGSGGREHAIAWKLSHSPQRPEIVVAPGNGGTASLCRNADVKAMDLDGQVSLARAEHADLVVVAPDDPLAAGLADRVRAAGLRAFGPSAAAARIESSKSWAKSLMQRCSVPTARGEVFEQAGPAIRMIEAAPEGSLVVKADGLAQGKGVVVAKTRAEASAAVRAALEDGAFGQAGRTIVLEERMSGVEVSVFAFVSGETVTAEVAACDYKRQADGDRGPNTGGMGAYSPPSFWNPELAARVRREVLIPAATAMVREGCPFSGMLYAGLMLTPDGPKVVEFNARFGDPETQVILPRLETDLVEVCHALAEGRLADVNVVWGGPIQVGVVVASGGYPGKYATGLEVTGLAEAARDALVFHAGTRLDATGKVVTSGGRVFTVVAEGRHIAEARARAYRAASRIDFAGAQFRRDIGLHSQAVAK